MENCKLTQFKGDTNNDNLPTYNGFVVEFDCTNSTESHPTFSIGVKTSTLTISVVDGANNIRNSSDNGEWTNKITLTASGSIQKSIEVSKTEKVKVRIVGKYNMYRLATSLITPSKHGKIDFDPIEAYKYSIVADYSSSFLFEGYRIDCADFLTFRNIENVTTIHGLKGNLSLLSELTYSTANLTGNTEIIGTLNDFPSTIESFTITGATKISGDFVDLVKHQRKLGRTTGSIAIIADTGVSRIKFNGSNLTDGNDTLSWDASTITWAGTTIQNSEVES